MISQRWGRQRQTRGGKWILKQRVGPRLTVGGSCTVSALAGDPLGLPAPLSGLAFQQLLNGVRSASPSRCSPAGHTGKDNDDMMKQQKRAQPQMQMQQLSYNSVNIRKLAHT